MYEKSEWDENNAVLNWHRHGIAFEMACDVFNNTFAIEWSDPGQDEGKERFVTVGMVEDCLLFVSSTMRREQIRVISARKAEPRERRRFHDENQA